MSGISHNSNGTLPNPQFQIPAEYSKTNHESYQSLQMKLEIARLELEIAKLKVEQRRRARGRPQGSSVLVQSCQSRQPMLQQMVKIVRDVMPIDYFDNSSEVTAPVNCDQEGADEDGYDNNNDGLGEEEEDDQNGENDGYSSYHCDSSCTNAESRSATPTSILWFRNSVFSRSSPRTATTARAVADEAPNTISCGSVPSANRQNTNLSVPSTLDAASLTENTTSSSTAPFGFGSGRRTNQLDISVLSTTAPSPTTPALALTDGVFTSVTGNTETYSAPSLTEVTPMTNTSGDHPSSPMFSQPAFSHTVRTTTVRLADISTLLVDLPVPSKLGTIVTLYEDKRDLNAIQPPPITLSTDDPSLLTLQMQSTIRGVNVSDASHVVSRRATEEANQPSRAISATLDTIPADARFSHKPDAQTPFTREHFDLEDSLDLTTFGFELNDSASSHSCVPYGGVRSSKQTKLTLNTVRQRQLMEYHQEYGGKDGTRNPQGSLKVTF